MAQERINQLQAFLADTPDDPFLMYALALEYAKVGDDAAARGYFETVLKDHPEYVGAYYHLGKLLERGGFIEEAKAVYTKGIGVAVDDKKARVELKEALAMLYDDEDDEE